MIPKQNIIAWTANVPWTDLRQIEQDLIISRALVDLFNDPLLQAELRFRGGTALNKLFFPQPLRYSEDIDLVRTTAGPIGPILDHARAALEPWLGRASFEQSEIAPKLRFRTQAEDDSSTIRLKVEINTREIEAYDSPQQIGLTVANPWFNGSAQIPTFSREELLATKLRALLQRDKGRDLLDLAHALAVFPDLDAERIVECFGQYLRKSGITIPRAEAEKRMFAKMVVPRFIPDIRPLLPANAADALTPEAVRDAFATVFAKLIARIPGPPWANTAERIQTLNLTRLTE